MKDKTKPYQIIVGILIFLIIILGVSKCNSGLKIHKLEKQIIQKDSIIGVKDKQIQENTYQLKLAETKENEANKRADEIKNITEKIKTNTTITINTPKEK
jgi:uncharacterized protein (DUF3084 family)